MYNTEWTILRVSDCFYEDHRMVYTPLTFGLLIKELSQEYNTQLIIDMEQHTIIIYDDEWTGILG